ncbi:MAG TPA: hypothetical protein VMY77_11025 [Chitinophagaceae bacterium]|nr:hypothetical protein [Chitinophagaceae bacterium]
MFNPFSKFQEKFIPTFRKAKKRYLVSQTFTREPLQEGKTFLILTQYDDKESARVHLNAISFDKFASIIDLEKEVHREKLLDMLSPQSKYVIYSSLTIDQKEVKKTVDGLFKEKVQRFINKNTNWRISRDHTVKPKLEITFGELYVVLKYGTQTIRVKLEEIENL